MRQEHLSRIMIAAPSSGSGKTLITCGLLRALSRKGIRMHAVKCGPDYIDPLFHRQVLGIASENLDTYFTDAQTTIDLLAASRAENAARMTVMEGVMGYFDGLGGISLQASSYDLACITQTPVILVVDASGMSRSVVALIRGFLDSEERKQIKGVILNRISPMMLPRLKELIENELQVKVLGCVPKQEQTWQSRHLGLVLPEEIPQLQEQMDVLADVLEKHLDLEALLEIADSAPDLQVSDSMAADPAHAEGTAKPVQDAQQTMATVNDDTGARPVRIGISQDEAFCFYYEDNRRILKSLGVELVPFSPLHDRKLPDVDGAIFCGGYPELHGRELSENADMLQSIRDAASSGMPMLAECGGFMYLQEAMTDLEGETHPMAGILPGTIHPTSKLVRFGYVAVSLPDGMTIKGHEFHYFDSTNNGEAAIAKKPIGERSWPCMVRQGEILAGFPHFYYRSEPRFAQDFIMRCESYHHRKESYL